MGEFYMKLYTIKTCRIFSDIPLPQLLTLALSLKLVNKQYNEVIIRQGKVPKKCYVVAEGLCKLAIDCIETMPSSPSVYARKSQGAQPKALKFGMQNFYLKKAPDVAPAVNADVVNENERNFSYENQLLGKTMRGSIRYKAQVGL
eukprot:TRINITY_DN6532_c0_g1_i3.p1 TRINITY_DN6532_c0_g1~~TRINITY_DN6532_c0_g1_i3.p1  ORF type:complete len:145 (+),score=26.94 TRINITY_DN6532_c0_g1_i3:106-540(+)